MSRCNLGSFAEHIDNLQALERGEEISSAFGHEAGELSYMDEDLSSEIDFDSVGVDLGSEAILSSNSFLDSIVQKTTDINPLAGQKPISVNAQNNAASVLTKSSMPDLSASFKPDAQIFTHGDKRGMDVGGAAKNAHAGKMDASNKLAAIQDIRKEMLAPEAAKPQMEQGNGFSLGKMALNEGFWAGATAVGFAAGGPLVGGALALTSVVNTGINLLGNRSDAKISWDEAHPDEFRTSHEGAKGNEYARYVPQTKDITQQTNFQQQPTPFSSMGMGASMDDGSFEQSFSEVLGFMDQHGSVADELGPADLDRMEHELKAQEASQEQTLQQAHKFVYEVPELAPSSMPGMAPA